MKVPVFKHTIERISAALQDEKEPLQAISSLVKYDPGLYLTFLQKLSSSPLKVEVTTISQAASLIGVNAIEQEIMKPGRRLDDTNSLLLWCWATLVDEAATLINERAAVAEPEEAFFSAVLPTVGMLLLLEERPDYGNLLPLLVKLSIEDRVFLEDRLFKKNHIYQCLTMSCLFLRCIRMSCSSSRWSVSLSP